MQEERIPIAVPEARLDLDGYGGATNKSEALENLKNTIDSLIATPIGKSVVSDTANVELIENQKAFLEAAQATKAQADTEANPMYGIQPGNIIYSFTRTYDPGELVLNLPRGYTLKRPEETAPEQNDPCEQKQREILI